MNAYELADELQDVERIDPNGFIKDAINMLRKQADRIERLEAEAKAKNNYLQQHCQKIDEQADRIAELEKLVSDMIYEKASGVYDRPQIKELSDEEIDEIMKQTSNWYDFARAILRKAQEADKIESLGTVNIGGVHFRNGKEVK